MKINNYIRGLAIFLLFIIPLLYLYFYFNKLDIRAQTLSKELVKDQLLREMDKFQDDLKPEIYIESAFKELEKSLIFPDLNNFKYNYKYNEEVKPDFINKDFINNAKSFLKEKFGFEPFIFVSSGFDLTNYNIDDKYNVLKNDIIKKQFLIGCIRLILNHQFQLNNKKFNNLEACIPSNTIVLKEEIDNILGIETDSFGNRKITTNNDLYNLLLFKNISFYYKPIGEPANCSYYFSNNFGNENIYQIYNVFFRNNNNTYNYLGLYYALIKSSDISIEALFTSATKNKNPNSKITRKFSNKKVTIPNWSFSDSEAKYVVPFPYYFYNFIKKQQSINDTLYQKYFDYAQNHSLEVSINNKSILNNNYPIYKFYIKIIIFTILICFILYNIGIYFNLININLSLSTKIRFTVAIAVLIPIIGLWLIIDITIKNEEKSYLAIIQNKVLERINLFDKLKEDIINGYIFDLLEHKQIFADAYFKTTPEKFYYKYLQSDPPNKKKSDEAEARETVSRLFKTNKLLPYNIVSYIRFLDIDGHNLRFSGNNELGSKQKLQFNLHLFRYLSDLNLLNLNAPENKKNYQQYILLSSYADQYLNTYNTRNDLAKESRLIPSETLTSKDKVVYQLLSSEKDPNSPLALLYNWISTKNIMSYRFTEPVVNKYSKLLEQKIGLVQVKYAFFERDADEFREKIAQHKTYPFWQLQLDSAKEAMQKFSSGSEIIENEDSFYLKVWRYYLDNPLIIVGAAVIPKNKSNLISENLITLLLVIYSILIVVLLSDFISGALLEPIKTLFDFVKEISKDHINVKINMKTGDELQELADSFNNMSTGLCEREKLKRFVSDKLFSSLSTSKEAEITQAKVTVLSSDIRNFTTISEKYKPEEVVNLLNDYFTLMEKSIIKYGGSIEKFVGDAISAAFYEEKNKNHALNACKAALEMRENLKLFNQQRIANNSFTIDNGIGLTTGNVMIGFAGEKARRREFLLIGNIIKLAENLESRTKKGISSKIFIDKSTYDLVKNEIKICEERKDSDIFYRELEL